MKKLDSTITLRTSETDFGEEFLDTEKLIQVLTPTKIPLPSAEKRKTKTPETIYRVYAYRHRSRCLTDFATVMDEPGEWPVVTASFLMLQLTRGISIAVSKVSRPSVDFSA